VGGKGACLEQLFYRISTTGKPTPSTFPRLADRGIGRLVRLGLEGKIVVLERRG
jgi:hypothetical protein